MDRLDKTLLQTLAAAGPDARHEVLLLLASFPQADAEVEPLALPLLELQFPTAVLARATMPTSARAAAEAAEGFVPSPMHKHTFQTEPWTTMPPAGISLSVAGIVLVLPWFYLLRSVRVTTHPSGVRL